MRRRSVVLAGAAAAVLAGCSLTRNYPEQTSNYVIRPEPGQVPAQRRPQNARMGSVRVATSFMGVELVYRTDEVRFTPDFYNRFMAPPAGMLATAMASWLHQFGPFDSVAQPGTPAPTAYVIEVVFTDLYGDFRANVAPAAVMNARVVLLDASKDGNRVLLDRIYDQRIELKAASAAALVKGYNVALTQILQQLAADLAKVAQN